MAEENPNWIEAHSDPLSTFYTFSTCISLADLNGDGDYKLVVADLGTGMYNMKIKVLKGTSVLQETALLDVPTGVATVYMDTTEPRIPGIIVASGSSLYVYKNMKPYYRFNLPHLPVNDQEALLWDKAANGEIGNAELATDLADLRKEISPSMLTVRTNFLLQLDSTAEADEFIETHKSKAPKRDTIIACMSTVKKSVNEEDGISSIVVGTEHKQILIIDTEAFTVLQTFDLPSVPVMLNVSGIFVVDFRILVACRDGKIRLLRKDSENSKVFLELSSQVVGMERVFKNLMFALMDNTFSCYTMKGKQLWSIEMPCSIMCTAIMDHTSKGFRAVMVGLENGEVRVYRDKNLVDTIKFTDRPQAMCFGKYGRETTTLVVILKSGAIHVLIMKRTCEYSDHSSHRGPPSSQKKKLDVPKKTQLFVDQTIRERESSKEIFQNFQRDLQFMRLNVAQQYLKGLKSGISPLSDDPDLPIKLSATIQGIGPSFIMIIIIENNATALPNDPKLACSLMIMFNYSDKIYSLSPQVIDLPALVPEIPYKFSVRIKCISEEAMAQGSISAFVIREGVKKPVITANIEMPVSEGAVLV